VVKVNRQREPGERPVRLWDGQKCREEASQQGLRRKYRK
jgi:hypothetical protein